MLTKFRSIIFDDAKGVRRLDTGEVCVDVSYVLKNVIAMSFPSVGAESLYRHRLQDVVQVLDARHPQHYMIWNLTERRYDYSPFDHQVLENGWPDHHAPPFAVLCEIVLAMEAWLRADRDNVSIIHCMMGKGRTGTIISCYLLFSLAAQTAEEALTFFAQSRMKSGKGVSKQSQLRYVRYFDQFLHAPWPLTRNRRLRLVSMRMAPLPYIEQYAMADGSLAAGFAPAVEICSYARPTQPVAALAPDAAHSCHSTFHCDFMWPVGGRGTAKRFVHAGASTAGRAAGRRSQAGITLPIGHDVVDDVLVRVYHQRDARLFGAQRTKLFHCSFHTSFVDGLQLCFTKQDLEEACKNSKIPDNFAVTFTFEEIGPDDNTAIVSAATTTTTATSATTSPDNEDDNDNNIVSRDDDDDDDDEDGDAATSASTDHKDSVDVVREKFSRLQAKFDKELLCAEALRQGTETALDVIQSARDESVARASSPLPRLPSMPTLTDVGARSSGSGSAMFSPPVSPRTRVQNKERLHEHGDPTALLSASLWKTGSGFASIRWFRRHCSLRHHFLTYTDEKRSAAGPKMMLDLRGCAVVPVEGRLKGRSFGFRIKLTPAAVASSGAAQSEFEFAAETELERRIWVQQIRKIASSSTTGTATAASTSPPNQPGQLSDALSDASQKAKDWAARVAQAQREAQQKQEDQRKLLALQSSLLDDDDDDDDVDDHNVAVAPEVSPTDQSITTVPETLADSFVVVNSDLVNSDSADSFIVVESGE